MGPTSWREPTTWGGGCRGPAHPGSMPPPTPWRVVGPARMQGPAAHQQGEVVSPSTTLLQPPKPLSRGSACPPPSTLACPLPTQPGPPPCAWKLQVWLPPACGTQGTERLTQDAGRPSLVQRQHREEQPRPGAGQQGTHSQGEASPCHTGLPGAAGAAVGHPGTPGGTKQVEGPGWSPELAGLLCLGDENLARSKQHI